MIEWDSVFDSAREHALGVHTWRHRDPEAARWLAYLASTGYQPSDIEQRVIDYGGD